MEQMLREAGMSGAGIKEAVIRSGAPIGSLYHYFPQGKMQLVSEALTIHAEKSRRLLQHFFDGRATAAATLRSLFNTAAEVFERAGVNKACAIGAVTLDLTPSDNKIRDVCKNTFEQWVTVIAPHLPFPDARSRRSFAMLVVTAIEGAFVVAKATRSGEPFRSAGEWLSEMVAAHEPDRLSRKSRKRR